MNDISNEISGPYKTSYTFGYYEGYEIFFNIYSNIFRFFWRFYEVLRKKQSRLTAYYQLFCGSRIFLLSFFITKKKLSEKPSTSLITLPRLTIKISHCLRKPSLTYRRITKLMKHSDYLQVEMFLANVGKRGAQIYFFSVAFPWWA